eukprot:m51a1_g12940 putative brca1 c terminus domain containing protein (219) ;mRNA; r:3509-4249
MWVAVTGLGGEGLRAVHEALGGDDAPCLLADAAALLRTASCTFRSARGLPRAVLVAERPARTAKYLVALAMGVPCVSPDWVLRSAASRELLPLAEFLLPAGVSAETGEAVEQPAECRGRPAYALDGMRVEVLGEGGDDWSLVLKAAGAKPVRRLFTPDEKRIDAVLVTACGLADEHMARRVEKLGLPLLSKEWLTQCIVCRKLIEPSTNPGKYLWSPH